MRILDRVSDYKRYFPVGGGMIWQEIQAFFTLEICANIGRPDETRISCALESYRKIRIHSVMKASSER